MKALRKHTQIKWVLLYVERWLKAPMKCEGQIIERMKGTPQGGVISPLLANLFMHYAFDLWMTRRFSTILFCRYADDGLLHCKSLAQAEMLKDALENRMRECGLEIHPDKTRIVYCKDVHRREKYKFIKFDFLGYTFRPRKAIDKFGRCFANFLPAVSSSSKRVMIQKIRNWHIQLKTDKSLQDIANMFGPILRGWANYYCKFHRYAMRPVWKRFNLGLSQWIMHKYKNFLRHKRRSWKHLASLSLKHKELFIHWKMGYHPKLNVSNNGSRVS
jgi:RNA-directed DNA polymerase